MIKTFIQERAKWNDILKVDTESGVITMYSQDKKLGFPFSEYSTSLKEMGYGSLEQLFDRMKQIGKKEVDTEEQAKSEINGLVKLAQYRTERNNSFYMILNDGTLYSDIIERLQSYGLTEEQALEKILTSECGKYENDCTTCPYNSACNRYANLAK